MKMTFDEYDTFAEKIENFKEDTFWPTLEQIDMFEKDPDKWILFGAYLLEHNKNPQNEEEQYSKANLTKFVNTHLELDD